jgi:L-lactate dehydrogenase (cytochrome)
MRVTYANIEELRQAARRRLPRVFFDYIDGGAFSEGTQRLNTTDFGRWSLEQRVLVAVSRRSLSSSFLGGEHALPCMLGPTGLAGMLAHRGEIQGARAAGKAGIPAQALFVTVDATLPGRRERDVHSGLFGARRIGTRLAPSG